MIVVFDWFSNPRKIVARVFLEEEKAINNQQEKKN